MNKKATKLRENATAGFEAFETEVLLMTKEDIFSKAYEINAKNEIHGYLCDCATEELEDEHIDILLELGSEIVEVLYGYFMGADNASIMFYSDITEWMQDYCEGVTEDEI